MKHARFCSGELVRVYSIAVHEDAVDYEQKLFKRLAKTVKKFKEKNPTAGVTALHGPYFAENFYIIDVHFSL